MARCSYNVAVWLKNIYKVLFWKLFDSYYGKCRCLEGVIEMFRSIKISERNIITWNAVIRQYGREKELPHYLVKSSRKEYYLMKQLLFLFLILAGVLAVYVKHLIYFIIWIYKVMRVPQHIVVSYSKIWTWCLSPSHSGSLTMIWPDSEMHIPDGYSNWPSSKPSDP